MVKNLIAVTLGIVLLLGLSTPGVSLQAEKEARDLYAKAKKKSLEQKWSESAGLFQELTQRYPDSRYADDAQFWVGFCLEKIPGRRLEAFSAYQKLLNEHPESSWKDDALIHQIAIAEQLILAGKEGYQSFLQEQLQSEMEEVRQQAALALGRLGDKSALPQLQEMKEDEAVGSSAEAVIREFSRNPPSLPSNSFSGRGLMPSPRSQEFSFKGFDRGTAVKPERPSDAERDPQGALFFDSRRYQQYRSMLKKENNWSESELLDFGLWHIVPTEAFAEYWRFSTVYDRQEWLRKFWKRLDPTPTTGRNEAREEFKRRVAYAKANFHEYWNYRKSIYLKDQYIREGWEHAPWDARGELYVKYGEPSMRTFVGWQTENWVYYQLNLDLIVKQHLTNIYGNAIHGTTVHGRMRRDRFDNSRVESQHIYHPEFVYSHDYDAEPLKDLDLQVGESAGKVQFSYRFPQKMAGSSGNRSGSGISFVERYVIFDEDLREVRQGETVKSGREVSRQGDEIVERVSVELPPGNYRLALRIQAPGTGRLGIYQTDFSVKF